MHFAYLGSTSPDFGTTLDTNIFFVLPADVRCPPSRKQLDAADAECPQAGIHTKTRRPQTLQSSVCLTSFPRFSSCGFSNPCEAAQESNDAQWSPVRILSLSPLSERMLPSLRPSPCSLSRRGEDRGSWMPV